MTQCLGQLDFGMLHRKPVIGGFDGGDISSNGGLMLVSEIDAQLGLSAKLAACLTDQRQSWKVVHRLEQLLRQRVYQIACGYEDCNDAEHLRYDPVVKLCVGRLPASQPDLASQPTLSRFENSVSADELWAMAEVLFNSFVAQYANTQPQQIILDFDATDDETHGQQQLSGFHGYYDTHCYLPLIVTAQVDGGAHELVVAMLRQGRSHAGDKAVAVLKLLVERLRVQWPQVQIIVRADSGFARPKLYHWCERNGVDYLIGLITNPRLVELAEPHLEVAREQFKGTGQKVRNLHEGLYAADSWRRLRRVLIKAEVMAPGENPRFVVTSLSGDAEQLYELYAARGDMENRIKELKRDLAMDRTSCHAFTANQLRLLLHAAAFVLLSLLRKLLAGTALGKAQVCTLQSKLLRVGVRVIESVRRVRLDFASSYPLQTLWQQLWARLRPPPAAALG